MSTLTVWRFDSPEAAAQALPGLERLAATGEARVDDAALVAWPPGRRRPSTTDLGSLIGPGTLWGGFWGVMLAVVFLTRYAGPTAGAAAGVVTGGLSDFGVADDFVKLIRQDVVPGTSALFVLSAEASAERLGAELQGVATCTASSTLSPAQDEHLRDVLGEESITGR